MVSINLLIDSPPRPAMLSLLLSEVMRKGTKGERGLQNN